MQYRGEIHSTDRLKSLNLPSLYYWRLRMDVIVTYKILHGLVGIPIEEFFQYNSFTKYKTPARVVNNWNSLLSDIVTATKINSLKLCWIFLV